jgi:hypothetical protein
MDSRVLFVLPKNCTSAGSVQHVHVFLDKLGTVAETCRPYSTHCHKGTKGPWRKTQTQNKLERLIRQKDTPLCIVHRKFFFIVIIVVVIVKNRTAWTFVLLSVTIG